MVGFEAEEGMIEESHWRESHQMMMNGLISTVRSEQWFIKRTRLCGAMIIWVKIAMDTYIVLGQ